MEAVILGRDGRAIARSKSCRIAELEDDDWSAEKIHCYFFAQVSLSPPVLFEHLAGTGLSKFFNDVEVHLDGSLLASGLRYVHGRSEVMRGKPTISSVLLARPDPEDSMNTVDWLFHLPGIYKKYLDNCRSLSEIP